jgi:ER lumen protein retaining receptor
MNIFRLAGDFTHVLSFIVLLLGLKSSRSAAGVSLKTQEMFLMVFLTRYLVKCFSLPAVFLTR